MFPHVPLLIILTILKYSRSEEYCVLWNTTTSQDSWDKKLHKQKFLHCNLSQPPRNQTGVPVKVLLHLKSFDINEYESRFTANVFVQLVWKDDRLTWTPSDYGGVDDIILHNYHIWVPSLILLNRVDRKPDYIEYGECKIDYDGAVFCGAAVVFESYCTAKLNNWPFDIQNCTLQFSSGNKYIAGKFSFIGKAVSLVSEFDEENGNGWDFVSVDSNEDPNTDKLSINITIKRQAHGIAAILVVSCFIICILSTVSFLLSVYESTRLGLLCFSLLCHFIFTTAIDDFLPRGSADTPVVLVFVRSSTIVTMTSILFTFVLSKIVKCKTFPFAWISAISSLVFESIGQYLIVPRWNINIEIQDVNLKNKCIWNNFANILNCVYMIIVVIVYFRLFNAYMPS